MSKLQQTKTIPQGLGFGLSAPYLFVLTAENQKALETRINLIRSTEHSAESSRNVSNTLLRRQAQRYISAGLGESASTARYSDPKPVQPVRDANLINSR